MSRWKPSKRKKALEERLAATFEQPVVAVALLAYDMCMVQSLQSIVQCDEWAEALRDVADVVQADYGSGAPRRANAGRPLPTKDRREEPQHKT
jgi:hypothetical protein